MSARRGLVVACAVAATLACDGQQAVRGVTEPILVQNAQFIPGDLPGSPPVDAGMQPATDAGTDGGATAPLPPLTIAEVDFQNYFVVPGIASKSFGGRATHDTSAVGIRLADLGTGYWVVPIAQPDGQYPTQNDFSFSAGFNPGDPTGVHPLRVVAIDGNGTAGTQVDTALCIESRVPDNLHACKKTQPVPAVVFSLRWDADFDLDLHVVTPSGTDINPKQPVGETLDAGQQPDRGVPTVDRDSLRACVPDGWRQEDLVFPQYPAVGPYDVFVDPFDSCGKPAARFTLTIWEAGDDGDLHATFTRAGELLSQQTTGGGSTGLFVVEKQFN